MVIFLGVIYFLNTFTNATYLLGWIWVSSPCPFISTWRKPFALFCRAGQLMKNSWFLLIWESTNLSLIIFSPLFLKDSFAGYAILVWLFFFFFYLVLSISPHLLTYLFLLRSQLFIFLKLTCDFSTWNCYFFESQICKILMLIKKFNHGIL